MNKDEMVNYMAMYIELACTSIELDLKDRQEIAKTLHALGYRKAEDDEIVIKKSEYEALKKAKNIIQLDISEEFIKECEYEMRELEQKTKQETAKKIFEDIEFYSVRSLNDEIWGNHFKLMDSTLSDLKMKYKAE